MKFWQFVLQNLVNGLGGTGGTGSGNLTFNGQAITFNGQAMSFGDVVTGGGGG